MIPRTFLPAVPACVLLAAPLLPLLAPLLAGCGAAASAEAPRAPPFEDLSTPDGAAAAVDRAERTLDQLLGGTQSFTIAQQAGGDRQTPGPASVGGPSAGHSAGERPAPQPPPPAAPAPAASAAPEAAPGPLSDARGKKTAPDAPHAAALDSCGTACSALASMSRAADHLCSLAGAADARCTSARTRVHAASARVHASCPGCGA